MCTATASFASVAPSIGALQVKGEDLSGNIADIPSSLTILEEFPGVFSHQLTLGDVSARSSMHINSTDKVCRK